MELRDYQLEDVAKLSEYSSRLIGNDLRTGKTATAVALDLAIGELGPRLIVCPKGVMESGVWQSHLAALGAPGDVVVFDRKRPSSFLDMVVERRKDKSRTTYFIMHWDVLHKYRTWLVRGRWVHVIGDEIHRIKSKDAQRTKVLKGIKSRYRTGLSGTPADNKPEDLYSVLHWLWPKYYGSYWRFLNSYVEYDEPENPATGEKYGYVRVTGVKDAVVELHEEMSRWATFRSLESVAGDMPELMREVWSVEMGRDQARTYRQMQDAEVAEIDDGDDIIAAPYAITKLMRLQQFAMSDIYQDGEKWDREREVWVPNYRMQEPSSKLDRLEELLIDSGDEPIIVFTQFRDVVEMVRARCARLGISFVGVRGGEDVGVAVSAFQDGEAKVFCGTIRSCNEGIDLSRSSVTVFLDRDWSPTANEQAEGRMRSLTKKKACSIIDIQSKDTVDEIRAEQIELKASWLKKMLGKKRKRKAATSG